MLLQAYQMRALVCCIDGVDEAAAMKGKIEDLVIERLVPTGIRTVVSSRPEGVRLERYKSFVVLNLSPLSDEQQRAMLLLQLKDGEDRLKLYDSVATLSALRKADASALEKPESAEHKKAIMPLLGSNADSGTLTRALDFFDEASLVPVMLSMMVVCLQKESSYGGASLHTSALDLYKSAARASIYRRLNESKDTTHELSSVIDLLATVAVDNHLAQRREFTSIDVQQTLASRPKATSAWSELEGGESGVPLIKTLEVGNHEFAVGTTGMQAGGEASALASKYQFKHLSFQEAFFAEALMAADVEPAEDGGGDGGGGGVQSSLQPELIDAARKVWDLGAAKALNNRWLLNTFTICADQLGKSMAKHLGANLKELRLGEQQVKAIVALRWEPLRHLPQLERLTMRCSVALVGVDDKGATSELPASGFKPLGSILADSSMMTKLTSIDFGIPATIGADEATVVAAAAQNRPGLRLCSSISSAQSSGLKSADAALIAATLRLGVSSLSSVPFDDVFSRCRMTARDDGSSVVTLAPDAVSAKDAEPLTLAKAFMQMPGQSSLQASSFPRELAAHMRLAGFEAQDLKGANLSTSELIDLGYTATELLPIIGGGPFASSDLYSASTLKGVSVQNLALELVVRSSESVEERCALLGKLRDAGCSSVPSVEDMEGVVSQCGLGGTGLSGLATMQKIQASSRRLTDSDGVALVWAVALYAAEVEVLEVARNQLGAQSAAAIGMLLRVTKTINWLDLHENELEDIAAGELSRALSFNMSVETLRISSNKFTVEGARVLCDGLTKNLVLRTLILEVGTGSEAGGLYLPSLKGLEASHSLDMGALRFGPLTAEVMGRLLDAYRPDLTSLRLDHNPIAAGGMAAIADMLKTNEDIKEVHLRFCSLGPEGTQVLAAALKVNTCIEEVCMLGNQMGDEGCKALIAAVPHTTALRSLQVQDNLISPNQKEALLAAGAMRGGLTILV
jgi:hypothetical protein